MDNFEEGFPQRSPALGFWDYTLNVRVMASYSLATPREELQTIGIIKTHKSEKYHLMKSLRIDSGME